MKRGVLILVYLVVVLGIIFFISFQYYPSEKLLKGYGGPCSSNYCEGEFPCLPIGGCSLDDKTGICIEDPIGGCHEIHPPISTRKCTFRVGSTLICEEGDREVMVELCTDYCYWVPFVTCECRSGKAGGAWVGTLHDCWYKG